MKSLTVFLGVYLLTACSGAEAPAITVEPASTASAEPAISDASTSSTPTAAFTATANITSTPTVTLTPTLLPGNAPHFTRTPVGLISHGSRETRMVALTFDVGEKPTIPSGFDEGIYQALLEGRAKATFFLGGVWMKNHPEETRRLASNDLFELGNHGWSHTDFPTLGEEDMFNEILRANDILYQLTGETTRLFRFPSGAYNDLALSVVGFTGMYAIQWDVVTADPVPDNEAENIVKLVMERVQNGSIIVMHANGRGWHTAEALPEMIHRLREQGYILVTISELMGFGATE